MSEDELPQGLLEALMRPVSCFHVIRGLPSICWKCDGSCKSKDGPETP